MSDHADTIRRPWLDSARTSASAALDTYTERDDVEREIALHLSRLIREYDKVAAESVELAELVLSLQGEVADLLAERQQAIDEAERSTQAFTVARDNLAQAIDERDAREKIIVEQQETVTRLRAEVDRLDAKVALLDDRNHWRWPNERALRLEAETRCEQAIDALREAEHQCRDNVRRAAFAPEIGSRYTEKLRLAIADECRKLEDGISAALVSLGETE